MHTNETKDKFIELRLKGHSLANISQAIGVSKTTLVEWNRECQQQLRELRSAELEVLHDRILESYEEDFNRLHKFQRGVDNYIGNRPDYLFNRENALKSDKIIRDQIRQMRKDIELFGIITNAAKNTATPSPVGLSTAPESAAKNLTVS
jgi:hypothetical protein